MLNNHLNVEDFAVEMNEDSLTTVVILSGSQVSLLENGMYQRTAEEMTLYRLYVEFLQLNVCHQGHSRLCGSQCTAEVDKKSTPV